MRQKDFFNLDAEETLLSILLNDYKLMDDVIEARLSASDFYDPEHKEIFQIMINLILESTTIDKITIQDAINKNASLDKKVYEEKIKRLSEIDISSNAFMSYARIIRENSQKREVEILCKSMIERLSKSDDSIDDILKIIIQLSKNLLLQFEQTKYTHLRDLMKDNLRKLESGRDSFFGLSTGIKNLDKRLMGLQVGQLITIGGRPAMGKTSLALQIGVEACRSSRLPVLYYSMNIPASFVSERILSLESGIELKKIRTNDYSDKNLRDLGFAVQKLADIPFYIGDSSELIISDIKLQAEKIKSKEALGLVIIEGYQIINSVSSEELKKTLVHELKIMAKELKCPVIITSQISRDCLERESNWPHISDLPEELAALSDIVMLIHRDGYYDANVEDNIIEIIIPKCSSGEHSVVRMSWNSFLAKLSDLK